VHILGIAMYPYEYNLARTIMKGDVFSTFEALCIRLGQHWDGDIPVISLRWVFLSYVCG
jgi:hypothetical protein